MRIDLVAIASKAKRVHLNTNTPVEEVVERVMKQAYSRDPKYWYQANEISKNIISEVGV